MLYHWQRSRRAVTHAGVLRRLQRKKAFLKNSGLYVALNKQ